MSRNNLFIGFLFGILFLTSCEFNSVTDQYGPFGPDTVKAPSQAIATPISKFDRKPYLLDTSKRYIYLSFDDGPWKGTMETYALCKELGVKATYFMIGLHAHSRKEGKFTVHLLKESYPQFLIANHSYSHALGHYASFYQHREAAFADFLRTQDTLSPPYKIIRLPGNNAWVLKDTLKASGLVRPLCKQLDSAKFNVIGWDTEWMFNHKTAKPLQSAQKMADQINHLMDLQLTFTSKHLILLTHDRMFQHPDELDSLRKMILILQQNPKIVFETVDHYPGLNW